jgi:thiamine biosynthesis protein ThiS
MDIRIKVNNKEMAVSKGTTVEKLLDIMGYTGRVAVWVDGTQLLGSDYPSRIIEEEDVIKVLRLAAGG